MPSGGEAAGRPPARAKRAGHESRFMLTRIGERTGEKCGAKNVIFYLKLIFKYDVYWAPSGRRASRPSRNDPKDECLEQP